jgi:uncharacterized membrane protein YdbT with pleckstrin-like domain
MALQLSDREHVVFEGHPSWRSTLVFYLKGLVAIAIAGALAAGLSSIVEDEVKPGWIVAAVLVSLVLVLLIGWIKRIATTYTITNHRLHIKRGIIARRTQEARLERVQNVNTDQGVLDRILQVGTVDFDTAGTTDADFAFRGVAQPEKVVRAVDQAQREHIDEQRASGL